LPILEPARVLAAVAVGGTPPDADTEGAVRLAADGPDLHGNTFVQRLGEAEAQVERAGRGGLEPAVRPVEAGHGGHRVHVPRLIAAINRLDGGHRLVLPRL